MTPLQRSLSWLRLRWFSRRGVSCAPDCRLAAGVRLRPGIGASGAGAIALGERCELDQGVLLDAWGGSICVGRNVFIGPYTVVYGHGGVEIGEETLISMHCRILSSDHTIPPAGVPIRSQPDILKPTKIGRDVWLGAGVTVLGGVTIGEGCVVGAGAVVTTDLPHFSVALGIPARVTRSRA